MTEETKDTENTAFRNRRCPSGSVSSERKVRIQKAEIRMMKTVRQIVQETINTVYPKYYPEGAVSFFLAHHSDGRIRDDIESGNVYLLYEDEVPAATVTLSGCHIQRLIVLPEYQHRGYGRKLMDFAETMISDVYGYAEADSSLAAKQMYITRGYKETEYHTVRTDNGDFLCYDVMRKTFKDSNTEV